MGDMLGVHTAGGTRFDGAGTISCEGCATFRVNTHELKDVLPARK